MKTKTTIMEITHDDLVDLFSTALYGSNYMSAVYDSIEYNTLPNRNEEDCYEDILAKLLLAGKTIEIHDRYAEDENDYYGKLPHVWVDDFGEMAYTVSLDDIKNGISKCFDSASGKNYYLAKYANNLANGTGDFDLVEAESIMQVIVFGEEIYG